MLAVLWSSGCRPECATECQRRVEECGTTLDCEDYCDPPADERFRDTDVLYPTCQPELDACRDELPFCTRFSGGPCRDTFEACVHDWCGTNAVTPQCTIWCEDLCDPTYSSSPECRQTCLAEAELVTDAGCGHEYRSLLVCGGYLGEAFPAGACGSEREALERCLSGGP